MKIGILGTRGIPANYGGFETFAEELSTRLVGRGHDITVYGRSNNIDYSGDIYRGVRLVILPTLSTKHLDTVAHTFLSVFHALGRRFDAILMCNAANAVFCAVPRFTGTPVALNVDGIERMRKKWGLAGRTYYRISETLSTLVPTVVVTDAEVMRDYYQNEHGTTSVMIAYGTDLRQSEGTALLMSLGLTPRRYLLYVSRLEPENNAHEVIAAYGKVATDMPLVIVGDAPYASEYISGLKSMADSRVRFTGAIYGDGYLELCSHAYAYFQATEVGGTHPALIEAMGSGNCILAKDTPEHREALGDTGVYFDTVDELASVLGKVLNDAQGARTSRVRTRERARALYSWNKVTDQYEELFRSLTAR
jgi:glycosyltransferase involved in cell wall biosynthesis